MKAARGMSLGNPLPVSLPHECRKATNILNSFVDPVNGLDSVIPIEVLKSAQGFAIFTVVKAGFLFSARGGSGIVIARLPDGTWSAPSAIGTAGVGFGGQAGAEITEFLLVLNSKSAVKTFMSFGQLSLGGNMSVAVGPLGRNAEGLGTLSAKGKLAAIFSYSKTKGLFGGVSVEGSVIVERADANTKAYGSNCKAKQILSGDVERPDFADGLVGAVARCAGNQLDAAWVDDAPSPADRNGTNAGGYSFMSSQSSIGSDGFSGGNRPRAGSRGSSRLSTSLSKFSPSFSRSGSYNNKASMDTSSYRSYEDDDDGFGGTWAADARKPKPKARDWRESGVNFDAGMSSDDDVSSRLHSSAPKGRSRSGTITPRKPHPKDQGNPFENVTELDPPSRDPEDNVFGDNQRIEIHSDSDDLYDPRRGSMDSGRNTINSNSNSNSDDAFTSPREGKFMFGGQKISQEKAALDFDDFKPSPPPRTRSQSHVGTALALYEFTGQEDGDLSFKKGDRIDILRKPPGEEWWVGRIGLRQGILPKNYVLMDD